MNWPKRILNHYFHNKKEAFPLELKPVIAKIKTSNELGSFTFYEVVYHNETDWCSFFGSNTFDKGEQVVNWKYCEDCLK